MAKPGRLSITNSKNYQSLTIFAVDGYQLKATRQEKDKKYMG